MRLWAIVVLVVTACQQASAPPKPSEITFDGAQAADVAATNAHGERVADVLGCTGCHGPKLEGHRFYERYASNLTRELPKYSDAQIIRVLRTGVPRDERDLWGMPSEIFQHLSSADMATLIVHLRSAKPAGKPTEPPLPWEPDAKELIAKGEIKTAKDTVIHDRTLTPTDLGPKHALGRYITMVTCAECHGPKLEGGGFSGTPNLIVAAFYTRAEFETLMTKGIPAGGRKFKDPLMGEVARSRFIHFTPHERDAVYAYLKARAEQPQ